MRLTYDRLYRASNFDGGKIRTFIQAWADVGRRPTEVDLAFFIDRSAHTSPSRTAIRDAIEAAQSAALDDLTPAETRRAVALFVPAINPDQRSSRLGRDVTFYLDDLESELTPEERAAWLKYSGRKTSDIGLSDRRHTDPFEPELPVQWRSSIPGKLSLEALAACPAAVLNPMSPPKNPQ